MAKYGGNGHSVLEARNSIEDHMDGRSIEEHMDGRSIEDHVDE